MEIMIPGIIAYKNGASTAKFPLATPLPIAVIKQMVDCRVKEYRAKGR
jgi:hypothetical protein